MSNEHVDKFHETTSDSLCRNHQLLCQLYVWLVSEDVAGKEAGCEGSCTGVVMCGLQL